jgi:tripartite ATP-independent transporter DctM subunit
MRFATGVIAASGTITQLIPPSLVLVILADQLGRSVGDMYRAAIGPSILQVAIFMAYTAALAILVPKTMPALPPEARTVRGWKLWRQVLWGMVPSIVLIFLVLGTIFMGIATPTEAGALGAVGAVILAAMHRRLTWPLVRQAMESTMRLSAMVMFILIGSTVFSLVFQGVDGNVWVEHMLSNLPGGPVGFLVAVNLFVFFLAFFLDFFEIAFIIVPLLAPVADKMLQPLMPPGTPPEAAVIWFGVILCVNMQTSFMHPPFGFALFYLRGIADQIFKNKTIPRPILSKDIYLGSIPWVIMQLILVGVVIAWPGSVTYWLGAAEKIDLDKASETLREMGGSTRSAPAPQPDGSASAAPSEDPMDEVRRQLQLEAEKKK